jgi:hypothetical protein
MKIFKNIKLFFNYRSAIKRNLDTITTFQYQFDRDKRLQPSLRVDNVLRIYGVINLPEETQTYMDGKLVQKHVASYIRSTDEMLNKCGLNEIVGIREMRQLSETSYLVVFGFSQFDTNKVARWIVGLGITSVLTLLAFLYI